MSQMKCLILYFISLISLTYTRKGNEVILVHKDKVVLARDLFEDYFSTTTEEVSIPEEETIILSIKNKRPLPKLDRPTVKIDINKVYEFDSKESMENVKCQHYKRGADLDMDRILDEWQVIYYQLSYDISCFKVHIVMNSYEEKKRHYDLYGNLSSKIDWNLCNLEIKSSDLIQASYRKHFLHGTVKNKGIMDNVIIEEHKDYEGKTKLVLFEEVPDQWLVVKDLLLMRDCETGGIVVFTRSSHKPHREDILDALMVFGEDTADGKINCYNNIR